MPKLNQYKANCNHKFKEIQKLVYAEYQKNGFEMYFNQYGACGDLAELGLIVTEISEAIECIRKHNRYLKLDYELADIIIRVMNFANRHNISLEGFIIKKNEINKNREPKHGNQEI